MTGQFAVTTPPTLSVLIPTPGQGRPLKRCLRSIASQPLLPGDECVVVGDVTDGPLPEVEALVTDFGPQYRYLPYTNGAHDWGHSQIQHGLAHARGAYLCFIDDDDIFLEGAFAAIRRAAAALPEPRPLMFRFIPWFRILLWATPYIVEQRIGGHNLVAPNLPERLGTWTARYEGDYDFVRSTVDLWPNKDADVVWDPSVIALARPDQ